MKYLEEKNFFFESAAADPETGKPYSFSVVNFAGNEGISKLYEFEITLVSDEAEIDLQAILSNPATLYLRPDNKLPVHGIISNFEQLNEVDGKVFYKALLVPTAWQLTLYKVSEVYLDMTFPEILKKILEDTGLRKDVDYRMSLQREEEEPGGDAPSAGQYRRWSYVCQYQETHFNFISRWMEREGVYYYFEQTDSGEMMVITDTYLAHLDLPDEDERTVQYSPPSGLEISVQKEAVTGLVCRQKPVPAKVTLQDFNFRKSPPQVQGEAEVAPDGKGEIHIYGEHVKNDDEAAAYAKLRAEEILCRQKVFHGEGTANFLRIGYYFQLEKHYRESYNQKYLLIDISHQGSQAALLTAGTNVNLSEKEQRAYYDNSFEAIENGVQFRPELVTPKPRFYGTINAKVLAEGEGDYAELDDYGRYKVKMPFDRSDRSGQKASRWIRMATPFAGPDEGMHFPLRKGTEVLLTFMDGDPDRPIIAAAVPGAEGQSPVTGNNSSRNLINTSGGNTMHFEDLDGKRRVFMKSPTANSWFRIGAYNDPPDPYYVDDGGSLDSYTDNYGTWQLVDGTGNQISGTAKKNPAAANDKGEGTSLIYRLLPVSNFFVAHIGSSYKVWKTSLATFSTSKEEFTLNSMTWEIRLGKFKSWNNEKPATDKIKKYEFEDENGKKEDYYIAKIDGSYKVFAEDADGTLDNQAKDSGVATINDKDWTLNEDIVISSDHIEKEIEFYLEKTVTLNVLDMGAVTPGKDGIRLKTGENLWMESFYRYGEFYGGRPSDLTTPTGQVRPSNEQLMEKYGYDYNPTNLKDYHSPGTTRTMEEVMDEGAHFKVTSFDTFNTQEGNIYDFGGYWNYNLGNCYIENHIDQKAALNPHPTYDMLKIGGPDWINQSSPYRTIKSDKRGGSKNELFSSDTSVWVEKKWGNSYEYTEGHAISITKGGSQDIQIGGKHIEEKYTGAGNKTLYAWSQSGKSVEEKYDRNTQATISYEAKANAGGGLTSFSFGFCAKATASIEFGFVAAFSLEAAGKVDISVSGSAGFKASFNASIFFHLKGAIGGDHTYDYINNKLTSDLPFTEVCKAAELKAEKEGIVMKALITRIESKKVVLTKKDMKVGKSTFEAKAGLLIQGL